MKVSRSVALFCVLMVAAAMLCGCSTQAPSEQGQVTATETPVATTAPAEKVQLKVFMAGSLTGPFEKLKAAFEAEHSNVEVLLEPAGSVDTIKKVTENGKPADVVASADYALIPSMMVPAHADWYVTFAKNNMVLTYTNESKYASEVTADNWYQVLGRDGVRWAFSDPNSDPCGYRAPMVIQLAEAQYKDSTIFETLVEDHSDIAATETNGTWTIHATTPNPDSTKLTIRPTSVALVQMLQSGGIDYAWEYRSVAVQNGLNFVELPAQIDLSSVDYASKYATVQTETKKGNGTATYKGAPIVYGATVPKIAEHPDLGLEFVEMLVGETGQDILEKDGQPPIVPAGGYGTIPADLQSLVTVKS
ncbi:MAG TPA: tungstate ABC transporter substrate-binding protein WtpA [Methanomicrobiales archaeon]|nr:tungstate ABC transporter substrate-binding protein WtpA [Methanomicrobiales archaeon]